VSGSSVNLLSRVFGRAELDSDVRRVHVRDARGWDERLAAVLLRLVVRGPDRLAAARGIARQPRPARQDRTARGKERARVSVWEVPGGANSVGTAILP
jgi:hypothetical protein